MSRRLIAALAIVSLTALGVAAQTPQPFPRPSTPPVQPSQPAQTRPAPPPQSAPAEPSRTPAPLRQTVASVQAQGGAPSEAMLGAPIFPNAQFITSYDAGRGQRFYIFGAGSIFAEVVTFYRTAMKQRGEVLFESPGTHMFEIARYRDESMAFPPSVTIKDFSAGGSPGYPNMAPGATLTHFPTIIQITPAPAAQ